MALQLNARMDNDVTGTVFAMDQHAAAQPRQNSAHSLLMRAHIRTPPLEAESLGCVVVFPKPGNLA